MKPHVARELEEEKEENNRWRWKVVKVRAMEERRRIMVRGREYYVCSPPTPHVAGTWEEKQSTGLGIAWQSPSTVRRNPTPAGALRAVGNFGFVNSKNTRKNKILVVFTFLSLDV